MAVKSSMIAVEAALAEAYNAAPKTRQKEAQSAMRRALQKRPIKNIQTAPAELLGLVDESEKIWAERVEALDELARLRGVTPIELMKQLGRLARASRSE